MEEKKKSANREHYERCAFRNAQYAIQHVKNGNAKDATSFAAEAAHYGRKAVKS